MNGECEYKAHGTDTDGTVWYFCVTHNELALSNSGPCEGYEAIPYIYAQCASLSGECPNPANENGFCYVHTKEG